MEMQGKTREEEGCCSLFLVFVGFFEVFVDFFSPGAKIFLGKVLGATPSSFDRFEDQLGTDLGDPKRNPKWPKAESKMQHEEDILLGLSCECLGPVLGRCGVSPG